MTRADASEVACLRAELERERQAHEVALKEHDEHRRGLLALLEDLEANRGKIERARHEWNAAFDAVLDPIFLHDQDFRIVRANRAYATRAGLPFREILDRPYWEVFPKCDGPLAGCRRSEENAHANEEGEEEVRLETGEIFLSRNFPVRDADGAWLFGLHIMQEVTEKRRTEGALRDSEEKFHRITAAAQDAILMMDNNGCIAFWNAAAERIFGYTAQEALGQELHFLLAPDRYHADSRKGFSHFRGTGEGPVIGQTLDLLARRRDGTEFPIELSVSALKLKDRWQAVGILRDITKRKQVETELKLFRALLDNSSDAVEVIEPVTLRFLDVNEKECRDLGYSREELLSMTVFDIDPSLGPASMKIIDEQVLKSGAALFERTHRRKDGSTFPVEISLRFVEIGKTYMLSIARDITPRKLAEAALQKTNRALKALSTCNTVLIHAEQEKQLLQEMCRVIVEEGGYRLAWIGYVEHDETKSVCPTAHAGIEEGYLDRLQLTWADTGYGRGPAGKAIRTGEVQTSGNILTDPAYALWRDEAAKRGYASSIALPLKEKDGNTFGILNIYAVEPDAFSADETKLLRELADDLAYGILSIRVRAERNRLQEEHVKSDETLRSALTGTIRAIALTVEKRDPYTAGHQNKVAELCVAIGRELGMDEERLEGMRLAATIHDIGKIYIPAEILNRPGKLSNAEFEIIKSHPEVGYDIIKDVKFPWPVGDIILQHHERMDGSGYPKGLKGEAIAFEARILAVADVVEAMTSHRPYRPGLGLDAALAEVEIHRGIWFDAAVVDACTKVIMEKRFQFNAT